MNAGSIGTIRRETKAAMARAHFRESGRPAQQQFVKPISGLHVPKSLEDL
jgi:hypothetical protein